MTEYYKKIDDIAGYLAHSLEFIKCSGRLPDEMHKEVDYYLDKYYQIIEDYNKPAILSRPEFTGIA
jgi:hypothetical protein